MLSESMVGMLGSRRQERETLESEGRAAAAGGVPVLGHL